MSTLLISFGSFSCPEISDKKFHTYIIYTEPSKIRLYLDFHNRDKERTLETKLNELLVSRLFTLFSRFEWRISDGEKTAGSVCFRKLCAVTVNICQYLFVVNWSKAIDFQHNFNIVLNTRQGPKSMGNVNVGRNICTELQPRLWYTVYTKEFGRNFIICTVLEHLFPSRLLHGIRYSHFWSIFDEIIGNSTVIRLFYDKNIYIYFLPYCVFYLGN